MSYPNMVVDFSDTKPDGRMLWKLKKLREISKPITDWRRIKMCGITLGYACSPSCADKAIAIFSYDPDVEDNRIEEIFAVGLAGDKGLSPADYRDVRCFMGCKWMVAR